MPRCSGTSESRCLIPKEQLASSKRPPATQAPPCHSCCILCCCIWCCIWCQTLFTTTPLCGFAAPPAHLSRVEHFHIICVIIFINRTAAVAGLVESVGNEPFVPILVVQALWSTAILPSLVGNCHVAQAQ